MAPAPQHRLRPAPPPRPNLRLNNLVFGPPAGRALTWLINGALILAGLAVAAAFVLMGAAKTSGGGGQCG